MEKPRYQSKKQASPKPTAADLLKGDMILCPCDKLIANMKRAAENNDPRQRVVLFQTGSYNPVHRMHVEMFEMVKRFIESDAFEKPSIVVGAFMSPSHDNYVSSKMKRAAGGPQHAYSSADRTKMLQLATASSDWIQISAIESSRPSFRAFNGVVLANRTAIAENLKPYSGQFPTEYVAYYVCGTDHAARAKLWRAEKQSNIHGLFVVSRDNIHHKELINNKEADIAAVQAGVAEEARQNSSARTWVLPNSIEEVSSTLVRRLIKEQDWDGLCAVLPSPVVDYLRELQSK